MSKPYWMAWLCVGLFLITFELTACGQRYKFHGTVLDPAKAAPDFTLSDDQGRSFRLADQTGKVVLLYFGYTHCPDVCPLTLAHLAQVRQALGSDAAQVQVVFVTTDPTRDTPAVIREYLNKFDSTDIGLRGDWSGVSPVFQEYYATAAEHNPTDATVAYTVDHSAYVYAIDRKGRWRLLFSPDDKVEDMVSDVNHLLHE